MAAAAMRQNGDTGGPGLRWKLERERSGLKKYLGRRSSHLKTIQIIV